jgi:hypothetical protein
MRRGLIVITYKPVALVCLLQIDKTTPTFTAGVRIIPLVAAKNYQFSGYKEYY